MAENYNYHLTGSDPKMKKIFSLLVALTLLLTTVPTVFAAGSAGWSGPDVVRAGDTITLTFYAGGGIYGGSGTVTYDPAILTLQGYTQSIGGSWALEWGGNNFVFYDNSMTSPITGSSSIFQATFVVNANAPVGAQITVSDACRGCIAHRCANACPKGAIMFVNQKAVIDHDKCITCGNFIYHGIHTLL